MTTIGVLNIIFGSVGSLIALLVFVAGGIFAAGGVAAGSEGVADAEALGAVGGIVMLIGIATLAINLLLFISGIGVLKVAPWGRTLSIAYGGLGFIIYGASLATSGFGLFTASALAYSIILIALCFTPSWKAAFCPTEIADEAPAPESEDVREAA
ncbi:MAG: hypothetical protein ACYS0G_10500 [Planctomycetota bacterium]|jgi:hypothetical protein